MTGGYSARLNPFTHFHSLLDLGACGTNDVPITELKKDLKSETKTANFSYISPDLCSAGWRVSARKARRRAPPRPTPGSPKWCRRSSNRRLQERRPADRHLRRGQPAGGAGRRRNRTPGADQPAEDRRPAGLQVHHQGLTDAAPYSPYSLLRTTEELFGLDILAKTDEPTVKTLAPALLGEGGGEGARGGDRPPAPFFDNLSR